MKLLSKHILFFSGLMFIISSCKKEEYHKLKFQIKFLEIPSWYQSNYIDVKAIPCYYGEYNNSVDEYGNLIMPNISYNQTLDSLWEYEYWELKKGDNVIFSLNAQLKYYYELRVFIDEKEMSYLKVKISNSGYFVPEYIEGYGLDDTPGDTSIDFIY